MVSRKVRTSQPGAGMLADMGEQPAFLRSALERFGPVDGLRRKLRAGSGSAYCAALAGAALLSARGLSAHAVPACEFSSFTRARQSRLTVVALSQSGASSDVVAAATSARRRGAQVIVLTNARNSKLASIASDGLFLDAGVERAVPATKTVTAMLAAMLVLAEGSASATLRLAAAAMEEAFGRVDRRHQRRTAALDAADRVFVLGTGLGLACALEGALKLKEAAQLPAEGYATGEFKHGATVMVRPRSVAIVISLGGPGSESRPATAALRRLGADVIEIGSAARGPAEPSSAQRFSAACAALGQMQRLALSVGLARGLNPDAPTTLRKRVRGWS